MPGTVSNLINEPVWVLVGSAMNSLTNLGFVNTGDVTVTIAEDLVDQTAHQTGSYILNNYFKGESITIEVEFSEVINWLLWPEVFLHGEKQIDTSTPPAARFVGNSSTSTTPYIGQKGTTVAQYLCLRPAALYVDATTETVRDFVVPKAVVQNVGAIPFGVDSPMILPVTFTGLFDPSASHGEMLWYRGLTTEGSGTWVAG